MHVLDRRTGIVTATALWLAVLLPIAMAAHAQAAAPVLLVLEKGAGSLAIVDPGQLKVVSRVEAGDDPHEIVASGDGRFAYISNYGASPETTSTTSLPWAARSLRSPFNSGPS
jgi:hypothetical protein